MIELVTSHIKQYDHPPKILGFIVTPVLVKTVLGYFLSAVGVVIISFLQNGGAIDGTALA